MDFSYTLDARRDALFLRRGPRESLWLQKLAPGDRIVCCHACRKVFYADDWADACPLCGGKEPLCFPLGADQLLWRERSVADGVAAECPMRALRVRRRVSGANPDETARRAAQITRLEADVGRLENELDEISETMRETKRRGRLLFIRSALAGSAVLSGLAAAFALARLILFK